MKEKLSSNCCSGCVVVGQWKWPVRLRPSGRPCQGAVTHDRRRTRRRFVDWRRDHTNENHDKNIHRLWRHAHHRGEVTFQQLRPKILFFLYSFFVVLYSVAEWRRVRYCWQAFLFVHLSVCHTLVLYWNDWTRYWPVSSGWQFRDLSGKLWRLEDKQVVIYWSRCKIETYWPWKTNKKSYATDGI